ncbi:MAG: hypothetical protein L6Q55_10220 [Azonexus sp.]|nr:hypothetical protein [Azonexus sp.]MCK6412782.1 hypothetical protein [Azonexus sp.]
MLTIVLALILLAAGVAAIYLLLKNMTEEGIDIAAPGSCRRGLCRNKEACDESPTEGEGKPRD